MKVTHLWVFLYTKWIIWISTNCQPKVINWDYSVSWRTFEYIQLTHWSFRCSGDFKFGQAHLKHHIWFELHILPHHNKCSSCWTYVSQIKICCFRVNPGALICAGWYVLNFTMSAWNKAFWYHHVVAGRVSAKCGTIISNNVNIV